MLKIQRGYLDAHTLETIASLFETATDWELQEQAIAYGPGHQTFSGSHMPQDGETYLATFDRSDELQANETIAAVARELGPEHRCYRMGPGHGFRIHTDGYFGGRHSHTLYLNREWSWDWGGLLHVLHESGALHDVIVPEFNTLVTSDYAPHFVSPVAPWARCPRYVLAVFGATKPAA